jgi:hypothetical protein
MVIVGSMAPFGEACTNTYQCIAGQALVYMFGFNFLCVAEISFDVTE